MSRRAAKVALGLTLLGLLGYGWLLYTVSAVLEAIPELLGESAAAAVHDTYYVVASPHLILPHVAFLIALLIAAAIQVRGLGQRLGDGT